LIISLKIYIFGKHFSYCCGHFSHVARVVIFFQTLIGGWLKGSLKQTDFEPPKLETKHLVFFPKIEDLFSPLQTLKVVPCTPNCKPSKCPHSHENLREYPKHLLLPLTYAFVIEHILPKLPWTHLTHSQLLEGLKCESK